MFALGRSGRAQDGKPVHRATVQPDNRLSNETALDYGPHTRRLMRWLVPDRIGNLK